MTAEERLLDLADAEIADFVARLIPHVPREKILGVRAPAITALARELRGTEEAEAFLARLPREEKPGGFPRKDRALAFVRRTLHRALRHRNADVPLS